LGYGAHPKRYPFEHVDQEARQAELQRHEQSMAGVDEAMRVQTAAHDKRMQALEEQRTKLEERLRDALDGSDPVITRLKQANSAEKKAHEAQVERLEDQIEQLEVDLEEATQPGIRGRLARAKLRVKYLRLKFFGPR